MVILPSLQQTPGIGVWGKEYSVGTFLFEAGDQVYQKPFFDMVGKFNKIFPSQIGFIWVNVGVIVVLMLIKKYSILASPKISVMLSVKVVVFVGENIGFTTER